MACFYCYFYETFAINYDGNAYVFLKDQLDME